MLSSVVQLQTCGVLHDCGGHSEHGPRFLLLTIVVQVQDVLTSEDEGLGVITSGERYSVLPAAVPVREDGILSQHQVSSWDTPVRPTLPNGGPVSSPILSLGVMDTAVLGHGMNDIGGVHDPFNAEAILSEVLGEDDPPKPHRPPPPPPAEVLAQHQLVKPVDVQPMPGQPATMPRAWRSVVIGTEEVHGAAAVRSMPGFSPFWSVDWLYEEGEIGRDLLK